MDREMFPSIGFLSKRAYGGMLRCGWARSRCRFGLKGQKTTANEVSQAYRKTKAVPVPVLASGSTRNSEHGKEFLEQKKSFHYRGKGQVTIPDRLPTCRSTGRWEKGFAFHPKRTCRCQCNVVYCRARESSIAWSGLNRHLFDLQRMDQRIPNSECGLRSAFDAVDGSPPAHECHGCGGC